MNKKILLLAKEKLKKLLKLYPSFRYVFLDNWRGYRLIYDTPEIEKYPGEKFYKSILYKKLKNEKQNFFSAGLLLASLEDKLLFGGQLFLNCKTYKQYQNCYAAFIIKKTKTKPEITNELLLLKNCQIIYAQRGNERILEKAFRKGVIRKVLGKLEAKRVKWVKEFVKKYIDYF